jgi:tetratricopeptide (TPR) repeat protein
MVFVNFNRSVLLPFVVTSSLALSATVFAQTSVPGNLGFEYQRLNNCGPMSAKMTLSLFGFDLRQSEVAAALKGTPADRNVTTPEMAAYLERFGLKTVRRWLITPALARRLIAAGFGIILHQTQKPGDDIGHFRVAYAFDKGAIYSGDSMFGPRTRHPDADFMRLSQPYNGEYLVAYKPGQQRSLERVLGGDWNKNSHLERLEKVSRARIAVAPRDAYAWWGLGQARLYRGSSRTAATAFRESARLGLPQKHLWYQQDALDAWNRVGWYDLTRGNAARALSAYPTSAELNLHMARALEGLKRRTEAARAWRAVLVENPTHAEARAALSRRS